MPEEILKASEKTLKLHDAESGQTWFRPTTLKDVTKLATNAGDSLAYVGGGTGWYEADYSCPKNAKTIIALDGIQELRHCRFENDELHFGSGVTLSEMESALKTMSESKRSPVVSALLSALSTLGSPQVRNVATVGGNIVWENSGSDLKTLYLAVGCKIRVWTKATGNRAIVNLEAWLSNRGVGDLVEELIIPSLSSDGVFFYRQARRKQFDLPVANACFVAKQDGTVKAILGGEKMHMGRKHVEATKYTLALWVNNRRH